VLIRSAINFFAIIATGREDFSMTGARILGPIGVKAFEGRGINSETAARCEIYTAKRGIDSGVIPDGSGNIVVFPFIEFGAVVNEKYRGPDKTFWQMKGGRRTFWNSDVMDDPALHNGTQALIITEGEIDALTAIDCGFPFTVSVPDGAPAPPKEGQLAEVGDDQSGKFEFVWNNRDRLKRIKRFIIAVDNDTNGKHLANELVRRLSAARCLFVVFPEGCKDLNDVRMQHGPERVSAVLNAAQPYPVKGLFKLSDYPDLPAIRTFGTGWDTVDELMKLFTPSLTVVTGIPGMGKSTWVTNLMINAARLHGWRSAVFSPEMPVAPQLRDKMRGMIAGQSPSEMSRERRDNADQWIEQHIVFIEHTVDDDEDMTLEWVLDRAADAVLRHGVRIVGLDPWNEMEHSKRRDESMAEYQNRALRAIRRFAIKYDVAVIVVAHPTKDIAVGGKSRVPSLYDIDGSAAWANKPDFGIVIHVPDPVVPESMIYISKVRFKETGQKGSVRMKFDRWTELYSLLDGRSASTSHYGKPV
jgi:twinkle protein